MVGCSFHIFYMAVLIIYNNLVYLNEFDPEESNSYSILLGVGTLYPAIYDFVQMRRIGLADYLSDPWNYIDMLYICCSVI